MVLYTETEMRPPSTFINNRFIVYNLDTSEYEPYVSPYASSYTSYPSDRGYDYEQGKITDDNLILDDLVSTSWDNDYADFSGSCNVEIPYKQEYFKYIRRGAYVELYVNRFPVNTDIEFLRELDKKNYKKAQEKADRLAEEYNKQSEEIRSKCGHNELFHPLYDFLIERSFKGFITDITYTDKTISLTMKNYGILLEENATLSFENKYRSDILYEVIHTAGLIPNIDIENLPDEVISWSNKKASNTDSGGNSGESITGDDCTPTQSMSCLNGCSSGNNYGSGHNFDDCCKKGYAVEGTEYYKWARKHSSGEEMLKALRGIWSYCHPLYYNNKTCPQALFNTTHFSCNCYDAARLVKCMCDSIGYPCVVVTGTAYGWGHGWNVIKKGGQWLSFDLCFRVHANATNSTNMSMIL